MEKRKEQENPSVIVGRNAVLEALRSGRGIECLYVQRPPFTGSLGRIVSMARQKRVLVKEAGKGKLDELASGENHQGIVAITPGATAPQVTDNLKGHYFFRTIGRDDFQGPFAAKFITTRLKPKNVVILHDKQTYGAGVAQHVKAALEKANMPILTYEGINAGDSDYSAVITKLKTLKPELVYFGGYHPEMGLLLRQAREQGLKVRFMGPEGVFNQGLIEIAGPAVEGMLFSFPADFSERPENKAIVEAFKKANRPANGAYQMPAYAAMQVLDKSIKAVGPDPKKVADYMHANSFDTTIGKVAFDAKGDLKDFEFVVFELGKDGSKKALK